MDIPGRKLNVLVDAAELEARRATVVAPTKVVESPLLRRYASLVKSAAQGAVYKDPAAR